MKSIVISILLGWSVSAAAEIYQWVDRDGHVHYGDDAAKQPGQKAEKLAIDNSAPKPDPEAAQTRQQLQMLDKQRSEQREVEAQRAAQLQQQHQQMQQRCKSLQDDIRDEQQVAVMFRYDDAGNRVVWTAAERVAYRERLQTANRQYCGAAE